MVGRAHRAACRDDIVGEGKLGCAAAGWIGIGSDVICPGGIEASAPTAFQGSGTVGACGCCRAVKDSRCRQSRSQSECRSQLMPRLLGRRCGMEARDRKGWAWNLEETWRAELFLVQGAWLLGCWASGHRGGSNSDWSRRTARYPGTQVP